MTALRILVIWFLSTLFSLRVSAQPRTIRIDAPGIVMLIDERLHTELPGIAPMSASETITADGREIRDFRLQSHQSRKINDKLGSGLQEVVTANGEGLRKELTITSYEQFPGVLVVEARYTNTGASPVSISGWTNHHYSIPSKGGEPAFWSFQSGSYSKRPDWVLPLKEGFHQDNFQGMNATDYGGGTPVADVWRRDAGLAVGHLDLAPKLVSLPVAMPDASHADIRIDYKAARRLAPGDSIDTLRTFVSVHEGDHFTTLESYRKMMIAQGVRLPESPRQAYEPIWCAWGYRRSSNRARSMARCRL